MNAKQRNANRETAQNLRFAVAKWDSRNRRFIVARLAQAKSQQPVKQS